jgi:hypothetical protein
MFPILNKYVTSELKNSKYCPANFLNNEDQTENSNKNKSKSQIADGRDSSKRRNNGYKNKFNRAKQIDSKSSF